MLIYRGRKKNNHNTNNDPSKYADANTVFKTQNLKSIHRKLVEKSRY